MSSGKNIGEKSYSRDELEKIIDDQFFDDHVTFDDQIVETVLRQLLVLDGQDPSFENMQEARKAQMQRIMKRILIPKKTRCS